MTDPLELRRHYAAGELSKAEFIARMHEFHQGLHAVSGLVGGDIRSIEISDGLVTYVSRDGLRFCCDPADPRAAPVEALNFGDYEAEDAGLFWSLVRPGAVIFDVGAHVGWYALHAAARFPTAQVYAFEPVEKSFELLRGNVRLNGLANVSVFGCGLSDGGGSRTMFVPANLPTAASTADLMCGGASQTVEMRRLDDVAKVVGRSPDVIKIDVEGAELSVLRGAPETLARGPAVFCEMLRKWTAAHGSHPDETIRYMSDFDYVCHCLDGGTLREVTHVSDELAATNFVFRRRGVA